MHADVIYVLEKGQIVETGSHERLLGKKGLYYACGVSRLANAEIP
jgi:ATP-binding cassette, subfamily B, bacterial